MEVSDDESGTDDSGITDDRITNNKINSNKEKECGVVYCDGSTDKSTNKGTSGSEEKQQESALNFLEQLDARIKSSKKESEKLR